MMSKDAQETLDLCNTGMFEMRGLVDSRFKTYPFVRDPRNGDFLSKIDYRPRGAVETATVGIRIPYEEVLLLDREQLIEYVRMEMASANEELVEFIKE